MSAPHVSTQTPATRAGFILLAGLPNAGKSTLLNRLVEERLSIVTPKAQTTWRRVAGIRSEESVQMVFVDTPGLLESGSLMHRSMMAEVMRGAADADCAVLVVDGTESHGEGAWKLLSSFLEGLSCPVLLAVNKADEDRYDPGRGEALAAGDRIETMEISAKTGKGVPALLEWVRAQLPESPFLYPDDELASAPTRFFVEELIRETVFEQYHQEVPYAVAVRVDEFRESQNPVYIGATIHVERNSQKGILVGKGGVGIRRLGGEARRKIEHFLGTSVYLDLWVKVWAGWRKKREGLKSLGFPLPDDGE